MKIIIVSNRLPVTIVNKEGEINLISSIGGLAKGLNAFLQHVKKTDDLEYTWIGWPDININQQKNSAELYQKLNELNCHPVSMSEKLMDKFYAGFCNKTIWPLFHYLVSYFSYEQESWEIYKEVNEAFSQAIAEVAKPGDVVWIHDYHLLLLPQYLRNKLQDIKIGFFLHIPFPSFEIFQFLPKKCRNEILEGMLGSDLIGFHTHEYSQHFNKCVLRMLGYEHGIEYIITNERLVKVDVYPMGIDFTKTQSILSSTNIREAKANILSTTQNFKVVLSIDRLDYTKGILNRLIGYRQFLEENPQWHNKVVLLLIVAPSREKVSHYQYMKRQIDEFVGNINGSFGNVSWAPIMYQYKAFSSENLVALYNASDVALVTPLMDGMNLIAKEYIASKTLANPGVLILSEAAGASKELLDALIINPNSSEEIASAVKQALEMSPGEKSIRIKVMQDRLKRYDIVRWGQDFINDLTKTKYEQENYQAKFIKPIEISQLIDKYSKAKTRLLIFDYDGTLVPFNSNPSRSQPSESLTKALSVLAKNEKNQVIIISGRDRVTLEGWLGELGLTLIAEHGAWIRSNKKWECAPNLNCNWKTHAISILESFTDKLPGSFIEEKDFSLAWHYRNADVQKASQLAKELTDTLMTLTANADIQVLLGNKVVEIKCSGVNKGIISQFIDKAKADFILCIGDDVTDEEMFKAIPAETYSIKVGGDATYARFNIQSQNNVLQLINNLINI